MLFLDLHLSGFQSTIYTLQSKWLGYNMYTMASSCYKHEFFYNLVPVLKTIEVCMTMLCILQKLIKIAFPHTYDSIFIFVLFNINTKYIYN